MSQTAQDKLGLESECFNMGPEKGSQVMAGLLVKVILVLGPGGHVGPLSNVLEMAGLASCPKKAASGPGLFFFPPLPDNSRTIRPSLSPADFFPNLLYSCIDSIKMRFSVTLTPNT